MKHQNNICQGKSDKKGVFASLIVRLIGKSPPISLVPHLPSCPDAGGGNSSNLSCGNQHDSPGATQLSNLTNLLT